MPDPAEQSEQEIQEGTAALQEIADDVEAERENSARSTSLPDDDAEPQEGDTREENLEQPSGPMRDAEDLEVGVFAKNLNHNGGPQH